jgi:predicted DCC family thiol-disulfide oxidoreductase YuxK
MPVTDAVPVGGTDLPAPAAAARRVWERAFLVRRPSVGLSLFRFAVAFTVGAHMIPSFFHMEDNYLSTAFRTKNFNFFPVWAIRAVDASPDWMVWAAAILFLIALAAFTVGWRSQLSCIAMTAGCYYFYALNNYHIGTLSFDILLVTLVLMCVTGYHGDFLSVDSLRRAHPRPYNRLRPFFVQRLLQLQLAWTFWYTALSKMTAGGNWLSDNPYYYLMNYPAIGVVREFPLRGWLAAQPSLCYGLGVALLCFEAAMPFLWFIPRARAFGIALGIAFQLMLWLTLHVPTIFLFLFPPLMLLFLPPERIVGWIEARQARHAEAGRAVLLYDGACGWCVTAVKRLRVLDPFGWLDPLDSQTQPDLTALHPSLTPERCRSELVLVEPNGRVAGGFEALTRIARGLAMLWWAYPLLRVPGMAGLGRRAYAWAARRRMLLHRNPVCAANQCGVPPPPNN